MLSVKGELFAFMVSCDICGKPANMQAVVEGATMDVCPMCSRFGKVVSHSSAGNNDQRRNFQRPAEREVQLANGFGKLIRDAREDMGFSRTDLAKKLNMRELDLLHFEEQKFKPTESEAKKLESVLKIRLVEESKTASEIVRPKMSTSKVLTLADVIVIKDKRKK